MRPLCIFNTCVFEGPPVFTQLSPKSLFCLLPIWPWDALWPTWLPKVPKRRPLAPKVDQLGTQMEQLGDNMAPLGPPFGQHGCPNVPSWSLFGAKQLRFGKHGCQRCRKAAIWHPKRTQNSDFGRWLCLLCFHLLEVTTLTPP